jgi:hypothetical protein
MGRSVTDRSTEGWILGQDPKDKIAFYGSTPRTQPSSSEFPAFNLHDPPENGVVLRISGTITATTVGDPVNGAPCINVLPYGFTQQQGNDIIARINELRADMLALHAIVSSLKDDLKDVRDELHVVDQCLMGVGSSVGEFRIAMKSIGLIGDK